MTIADILQGERPADIARAREKTQEQSTRDKRALLKKAEDLDKTLAALGYTVDIYKKASTGASPSVIRCDENEEGFNERKKNYDSIIGGRNNGKRLDNAGGFA